MKQRKRMNFLNLQNFVIHATSAKLSSQPTIKPMSLLTFGMFVLAGLLIFAWAYDML